MKVFVTGATGYIGGRLVPRLLDAGHAVRVLVRDKRRLSQEWARRVEVVEGDLLGNLPADALRGIDVAYYLVHSMGHHKDFEARDRQAAQNFVDIAKGVHIVYLGGLQPHGAASPHLRSRAEVGAILAQRSCTELRAGPIIGSGSASFEMVRYLTERLPVMVTPKWIHHEVSPIAIRDVLAYLLASLDAEPGIIDVAGDTLPFGEMMQQYAAARGLTRHIYPTPVLAPRLAARWVQFITPISNKIAVPLLAGIVHPIPADTREAKRRFPAIHPLAYEAAVRLAIERTDLDAVETRWTGSTPAQTYRVEDWENLIREERAVMVNASPAEVWHACTRVGGEHGWPAWAWAWRIRGAIDKAVGGPGLHRGRRSQSELRVGDAVDFWRVEALEPEKKLRLASEMRMPGRAWLQWQMEADGEQTRLIQQALYEPRGLAGALYWKSLYFAHRLLFRDMLHAIAQRAEAQQEVTV